MREFHSWVKYQRRRGSLHLGMRVERGAALLASMLANQVRDNKRRPEPYTPEDFMRHGDQVVASLDLAMATWS
ncbi:phage tail assembly protein T [Pseudomonas promysalinigenes]|uniref:phage tail assembly protein T n=1 Tax=Pseudomonas promysalinigenes TaxID=485898 RepID=UPI003FA0F747